MQEERIYISKLSDYMEFVENLDKNFILSRGQDKPHSLLPSAMRKDEHKKRKISRRTAKFYLDEFKMNSYHFMNRPWDINSEIEWMIYAQHYGIPTNLLDFTKSHIVALLFAVEKAFDNKHTEDSVIYFLNPYDLNSQNIRRSELVSTLDNDLPQSDGPFVIQGRKLNMRIQAQNGLFAFFNDDDKPLDTIENENILKRVFIKSADKKHILASIFTMGISFSHIYPELSYISKDILMKKNILDYLKEE